MKQSAPRSRNTCGLVCVSHSRFRPESCHQGSLSQELAKHLLATVLLKAEATGWSISQSTTGFCASGETKRPPWELTACLAAHCIAGLLESIFKHGCQPPPVRPNPSLERDLHRHGTWPARRSGLSFASRAKRHTGVGPSAQTLGLTTHMKLPSVVELELWSSPGTADLPLDGKAIAERCRSENDLPEHVVLGLSFVPDETDVRNVLSSFEAGESSEESFISFCAAHALPADPKSASSAAMFLAYIEGQPLAWLHLPVGQEGLSMCQRLCAWASRERLVVCLPKPLSEPAPLQEVLHHWPQ